MLQQARDRITRQVMKLSSDVMEPQVRGGEAQVTSQQDVVMVSSVSVDVGSDGEAPGELSPPTGSLNSLRPFHTAQKPTCGFSFSWDTDHKHKPTGLQPHNPIMWRNNCVYKQ